MTLLNQLVQYTTVVADTGDIENVAVRADEHRGRGGQLDVVEPGGDVTGLAVQVDHGNRELRIDLRRSSPRIEQQHCETVSVDEIHDSGTGSVDI